MTHRRHAFTLVELLVVLAILSILAALLFPVFARAKRASKAPGCLSNLHQLHIALLNYLEQYDERFPVITFQWAFNIYDDPVYGGFNQPAHESKERENPENFPNTFRGLAPSSIFRCPADIGAVMTQDLVLGLSSKTFFERFGTSYRPAGELGDYDLTLADVPDTTHILWASDASGHWHEVDASTRTKTDIEGFVNKWRTQVVYLDGHVRSVRTNADAWLPYNNFLYQIYVRQGRGMLR